MEKLEQHRLNLVACAQGQPVFTMDTDPSTAILSHEEVVRIGLPLLQKTKTRRDEQYYNHCELVCQSLLYLERLEEAEELLEVLRSMAPEGSQRLRVLKGLKLEAESKWKEAEQVYQSILAVNETHQGAKKRLIALLRRQGKMNEAVASLNAYLDVFQTDPEAWSELMDLYRCQGKLDQAAFCAEELIMLRPLVFGYHLSYAQILMGLKEWQMSRKYFCKVLELYEDQVDALLGLLQCEKESQTQALTQTQGKRKTQVGDLSADELSVFYQCVRQRLQALVKQRPDVLSIHHQKEMALYIN